MTDISPSTTVGEIVAAVPAAADVFKKYNIDFCCGGNRSLAAAIAEAKAPEGNVVHDLESSYEKAAKLKEGRTDWRQAPLDELVDYVVNTHHAFLRQALPELSELTTTILRVHGANHPELSKVHRLFHTLKMELEQHLITEEETLFPLVKEYAATGSKELLPKMRKLVEQLENEHEGAGDVLKELRSITKDFALPDDACGTYGRTYARMTELESDLFQHIHLENNILHPRLQQELLQ